MSTWGLSSGRRFHPTTRSRTTTPTGTSGAAWFRPSCGKPIRYRSAVEDPTVCARRAWPSWRGRLPRSGRLMAAPSPPGSLPDSHPLSFLNETRELAEAGDRCWARAHWAHRTTFHAWTWEWFHFGFLQASAKQMGFVVVFGITDPPFGVTSRRKFSKSPTIGKKTKNCLGEAPSVRWRHSSRGLARCDLLWADWKETSRSSAALASPQAFCLVDVAPPPQSTSPGSKILRLL